MNASTPTTRTPASRAGIWTQANRAGIWPPASRAVIWPPASWAGVAVAVIALALATARAADTHAINPRPRAHASTALRAKDTARLHYVSAQGAVLIDEGQASGTVPGHMRVHLRIGATFSGSFTLYTSAGTIAGHGSATPHGSGTYESFAGSIVATGGTGRYRHAHGRAQLYGVFNRSNYSFVIQTAGTLYF